MSRLIKALKTRHEILEARVREEQKRPNPDTLRLTALKKIKLQLRDQIASLERLIGQNVPGSKGRQGKRQPIAT